MTEEQKEEKEEEKIEPEITTLKELVKSSGLSKDKLEKIALVCMNCGHKDLLVNFVEKKPYKARMGESNEGNVDLFPPKRKPKPHHYPRPMRIGDPVLPKPPFYSKATTKAITTAKPIRAGTIQLSKGKVVKAGKFKNVSHMVTLGDEGWDGCEEYFKCPKCNSALICLDADFVKNNLLRGIENGGEDGSN